jgi:hypothetical protein
MFHDHSLQQGMLQTEQALATLAAQSSATLDLQWLLSEVTTVQTCGLLGVDGKYSALQSLQVTEIAQ